MKTRLKVLSWKIVLLLAGGVSINSAQAIPNGSYLEFQPGKVSYDCMLSTLGSGSISSSGENSLFQGEFALSHNGNGNYSGNLTGVAVESDIPIDVSHYLGLSIAVVQKNSGEAEICDLWLRSLRHNENVNINDNHFHDVRVGERTLDGGCSIRAIGGSVSGSVLDQTFSIKGGNYIGSESNADDDETDQDLYLRCQILVSIPTPVIMRGGQPIANGSQQSK